MQTSIVFTVSVTDSTLSDSSEVTVSIINVNDNKPQFTQTSYQVSATKNIHFNISVVQVIDADGDIITYSIASSCNDGFEIDSI